MTGTDLQIIKPKRSDIAGGDVERLPTLHTSAKKDKELVAVWLKSHADGSRHTLRAYERIGQRFIAAIDTAGTDLRHATIDDVQSALEAIRVKEDGSPASAATINTQVAAIKALLGFAHQVGYTRFNVGPLIKIRKAPRKLAQRIMPEVDIHLLIRATGDSRHPERDRVLFETAYYGGLRVSELASLTWEEIIPRENGEVQLAVIGKGDKPRHVLLPAEIATRLLALREGARAKASVFGIKEREINYLIKRTAARAGVNEAASAHWFRHAHASHAIDNGAPITLVSQTLGHADLKTTSVYAHARPNESSSRFLKKR
ncbi:MAG: tyrosine-type recombinase/integrase [Hyphomicrobium sp.]|uniref:tyrosine-type recombinase/integrase n=1 Tax=Hyphomicrobium sp. TaxID=82 RepID=UPI0039E4B751